MAFTLSDLIERSAPYFHDNRKTGIVAGAVSLVLLYSAFRPSGSKNNIPLVPYTWPFLGSSGAYASDPEGFLKECVQKYGSVFRVHLGGSIKTIISGKQCLEVLQNPEFNIGVGIKKVFDIELLLDVKGEPAETPELRKLISKLTLRLAGETSGIVENIEHGYNEFLDGLSTGVPLSSDKVLGLIVRMLATSTASTFVGRDTVDKHPDVVEAFSGIIPVIGNIFRSSLIAGAIPLFNTIRTRYASKTNKSLEKHKSALYNAIRPIVEQRFSTGERKDDMVQWIIDMKSKGETDVDKVAQYATVKIIVLIFASMHSSSTNAVVAFYNLVERPWLVEELLMEQEQVLQKHGISPDETNPVPRFTAPVLKDLAKLDSTIRESNRTRKLYLQNPQTYIGTRDHVLSSGAVIKPDDDVLLATWINHYDPTLGETGGDDLDAFMPFRFVGTDLTSTRTSANYLAFGSGRHICPGRFFAVQQIKIILSILIYRYKFTPATPVVVPQLHGALPYGDVLLEKRNNV